MAILSRRKGKNADRDGSDGGSHAGGSTEKKTFAARKPANTAFKQQRLKAWQPILTPKTVLPTFFLVGLIFAPIGAVLYYYASRVRAERKGVWGVWSGQRDQNGGRYDA